jgi:hypothetical protein
VLLLVSGACVALLRQPLGTRYHEFRVAGDVYALPSPRQTVVASLGYRAALADLLYAKILVEQGLHFEEKRLFEFVGRYLETINELDPKFRSPYVFADTLLTMQPVPAPWEYYVVARRVLERGMKERPFDTELWLQAGQFMAYLAGGRTEDSKIRQEWSLSQRGENDAMLRWLQRVIAVVDDENVRRLALGYLKLKIGERQQRRAADRLARVERAWKQDLGFLSKDGMWVLGPAFDPWRCAGLQARSSPACATSWRDWGERNLPADEAQP